MQTGESSPSVIHLKTQAARTPESIAVVDGRQELVGEIQTAQSDVRSYLGKEIAKLLGARKFLDALSGHLAPDSASQERITTVMARLREIALLLES